MDRDAAVRHITGNRSLSRGPRVVRTHGRRVCGDSAPGYFCRIVLRFVGTPGEGSFRSEVENRICGTAHFSTTLVHEVFREATASDYDLKFRSDSEEERKWAMAEYETVVLNRQQPKTAKPPSSQVQFANNVVAALSRALQRGP